MKTLLIHTIAGAALFWSLFSSAGELTLEKLPYSLNNEGYSHVYLSPDGKTAVETPCSKHSMPDCVYRFFEFETGKALYALRNHIKFKF